MQTHAYTDAKRHPDSHSPARRSPRNKTAANAKSLPSLNIPRQKADPACLCGQPAAQARRPRRSGAFLPFGLSSSGAFIHTGKLASCKADKPRTNGQALRDRPGFVSLSGRSGRVGSVGSGRVGSGRSVGRSVGGGSGRVGANGGYSAVGAVGGYKAVGSGRSGHYRRSGRVGSGHCTVQKKNPRPRRVGGWGLRGLVGSGLSAFTLGDVQSVKP